MAYMTDMPVELLFCIAAFAPRADVLTLMRTCRYFLRAYAVELYSTVDVKGMRGRLLALSILTSKILDYGNLINRFTFRGEESSDHLYLTYPLVVDALTCMNRLTKITIIMSTSHAHYFTSVMRKQGLFRTSETALASVHLALSEDPPFSRYNLPHLEEIVVDGDPDMLRLAMNRRITRLTCRSCLNSGTLADVLSWTNGGLLLSLSIKLFVSTSTELVMIMYGISESCPNIQHLEIATGMFNALDVSFALSSNPVIFPKARSIWLNQRYLLPPVHGSPVNETYNIQLHHLEKASESMPFLTNVKFGVVDWTLHYGISGTRWRSEYFRKEIWEGPQWLNFKGDFSCMFLKE
ncbi:hypothetical protein CVT26_011173 [Gymnopilus dilepis]|uniref:F-box domain-containing protein n=1 Tax=Gymnopilus dilepis TaxID=231916 RepID=A0A409VJQ7_9AGAR|nr:hypothetical protein CVT26_011173 [Gymnopilus dilepis]